MRVACGARISACRANRRLTHGATAHQGASGCRAWAAYRTISLETCHSRVRASNNIAPVPGWSVTSSTPLPPVRCCIRNDDTVSGPLCRLFTGAFGWRPEHGDAGIVWHGCGLL